MQLSAFESSDNSHYENTIVGERQRILADREVGTYCSCCFSFCKMYKRKLNVSMSVVLIYLNKYPKDVYIFVEKMIADKGLPHSFRADFHKLVFWKMIEGKEGKLDDGNPDNGLYRITEKGRCFVRGEISVPEYALIYHDKCEWFSEKLIFIREALKNKFNYDELMHQ